MGRVEEVSVLVSAVLPYLPAPTRFEDEGTAALSRPPLPPRVVLVSGEPGVGKSSVVGAAVVQFIAAYGGQSLDATAGMASGRPDPRAAAALASAVMLGGAGRPRDSMRGGPPGGVGGGVGVAGALIRPAAASAVAGGGAGSAAMVVQARGSAFLYHFVGSLVGSDDLRAMLQVPASLSPCVRCVKVATQRFVSELRGFLPPFDSSSSTASAHYATLHGVQVGACENPRALRCDNARACSRWRLLRGLRARSRHLAT